MNEGIKKFLKDNGIKMTITFVGPSKNKMFGDNRPRHQYRGTLTSKTGQMRFMFWDSLDNTQKPVRETPPEADLLYCLPLTDPGTFKDFCWEFGYDEYEPANRRTYKAIYRQWLGLNRVFTPTQLDWLAEYLRDY